LNVAALVDVQDLVKQFGSIRALDGLSFSVDAGGPVGLVGRNGAGKTTLLSVLGGVFRSDAGSVSVCGAPLGHRATLGRIGMLMQDAHFKRGMSSIRQLQQLARLGGLTAPEAMRQSRTLLRELGDDSYANRPPEHLSYGQRKRLGVAQAMLGNPSLVLLDEPTAGLDPVAASSVRELIRNRSTECTFIVSSHNLYEIQDICDRVLVIDKGRLIADTDMAAVTGAGGGLLTLTLNRAPEQALLDALNKLAEVREARPDPMHPAKLEAELAVDADAAQMKIQTVVHDHGYSVVALSRGKGLLEHVISLVGSESGSNGVRG
jgi:ABC-type multidrug transport system ATPase subunit